MAQPLILVESAGKARAIKKFIGTKYDVVSTEGLLKDLPKSRIGIDAENSYAPDYITIRGKGKFLQGLKKITLEAGRIYMAFNPDPVGEFLSKQCCEIFGVDKKTHCRMVFDELTKTAVRNAVEDARPIDETLVDTFQTKQIIDKFVSHKMGEYLSYKIYRGVKVGRFRAMLLKLMNAAQPAGTFNIAGALTSGTLQELALARLDFSPTKTRLVAEQLYEGVKLDKNTFSGLIKYPHGDILLIDESYAPEAVKDFLNDSQFKLYNLIYDAVNNGVDVNIELKSGCTDLSLMVALDIAKIDWSEYYTVGINSLLKRQYIVVEDSKFQITDLGKRILNALRGHFNKDFTTNAYKNLAEQIDEVATGAADKNTVIENYCTKIDKSFDAAMASLPEGATPQEMPVIETDEVCEVCGKKMVIRRGRYGRFISCSGYPECKNIKPYFEYLKQRCPKCDKRLTKRVVRGRNLYLCESCDFRTWDDPQETPCRVCGSTMFLHKFKDRSPMLYCGNDDCETRSEHPINKILEDAQKRYENYKARAKSRQKH